MIADNGSEFLPVWGATDIGKIRPDNEDRVGAGDIVLHQSVGKFAVRLRPESGTVAAVVADGVGGSRGGSIAAELAVTAFLNRCDKIGDLRSLKSVIDAISESIRLTCAQDAAIRGGATTIAGVVFSRVSAIAFNVGDSRVYQVSKAGMAQLSQDHVSTTDRRMLTRFLGGKVAFAAPYASEIPNWFGTRYLICSDGLFGSLADSQIYRLAMIADGNMAADALVGAAMEAGAPDNVTVALCGNIA